MPKNEKGSCMKTNRFKLVGVIVLVAIMGFAFVACSKSDPESDFEAVTRNDGKGVWIYYIGDKQEVVIPSKIRGLPVTTIGSSSYAGAFLGKHLTSITIPNSVTTIEGGAFIGNQLTKITIPKSVTTIGAYAFARNQLTSVTIGANVSLGTEELGRIIPTFDNGFDAVYNKGGKAAGTYTRPNTDSTAWTKK
jgi:predicted lipoprotein with Yx(FWY)xxD motif